MLTKLVWYKALAIWLPAVTFLFILCLKLPEFMQSLGGLVGIVVGVICIELEFGLYYRQIRRK